MDYKELIGKSFNEAKQELREAGMGDYLFVGEKTKVSKKNKAGIILRLDDKSEVIEIVNLKKEFKKKEEVSKENSVDKLETEE